MALSTSGKISVSDIQEEMGNPAGVTVSLSSLAAQWKAQTDNSIFNAPHKMSDWRGKTWEVAHSLTIHPEVRSIIQEGQTFEISVISNVNWFANSGNDARVTSIGPPNGSGNGTVSVTVSRNDGSESRSGTITISTSQLIQTLTWTQPAGSVISPPDGGTGGGSGGGSGGGGGGSTGGGDGSGGGEIVGPEGGTGDTGSGFQ